MLINQYKQLKTVQDYINYELLDWLLENNISYAIPDTKLNKGTLNILYNNKVCLKIYDRLGHGFGATVNVVDQYDESIYDNDNFSLHWAFEYCKLKQTASFSSRTENQYHQNLPNLIWDIKEIFPRLNQMTSSEWGSMLEWISNESHKQFS